MDEELMKMARLGVQAVENQSKLADAAMLAAQAFMKFAEAVEKIANKIPEE